VFRWPPVRRSRRRHGGRAQQCGHGGCRGTEPVVAANVPFTTVVPYIIEPKKHPPLGGRTTALPCVTALIATGRCRCARVGVRAEKNQRGCVVNHWALDMTVRTASYVDLLPGGETRQAGRARSSSVLTRAPAWPIPPAAGGRERGATPTRRPPPPLFSSATLADQNALSVRSLSPHPLCQVPDGAHLVSANGSGPVYTASDVNVIRHQYEHKSAKKHVMWRRLSSRHARTH